MTAKSRAFVWGTLFGIATLIGAALYVPTLQKSLHPADLDLPFSTGARAAVAGIAASWAQAPVPADSAAAYSAQDALGDVTPPLDEAQQSYYAKNNAFIVLCALAMMIGFLAFPVFELALIPRRDPAFLVFLRYLGTGAILFVAYRLVGFNVNYPGGQGFFNAPDFGVDADLDGWDYGLGSYSLWADVIYQAPFSILAGIMVLGYCAAGFTARAAVPLAIMLGAIVYPTVCSWHWGGGFLGDLGETGVYDFAGGALIHAYAGAAGLVLAVGMRVLPAGGVAAAPGTARPAELPTTVPPRLPWLALGGALLLVLAAGTNGGSTLDSDGAFVASVLKVTFTGIGSGAAGALALGSLGSRKRLATKVIAGAAGGWAVTAAGTDILTFPQCAGLGLATGLAASAILLGFDRLRIPDPLGLASGNLVGGTLGTLAIAFIPEMASDDRLVGIAPQLVLVLITVVAGASVGTFVVLVFGLSGGLRVRPTQDPPPIPPLANAPTPPILPP